MEINNYESIEKMNLRSNTKKNFRKYKMVLFN
jgi:hypothetical protein